MSLKPKPIQIYIPNPCHEDWQQMASDEKGRFCAHCQKSVIDFTGWSDTALFNFFNKNTEGVCGRFLASQVNRPIHIPYQPHSKLYRLVIAAGFVLLFTQPVAAQTQSRPPLTNQSAYTSTADKADSLLPTGMGSIRGQVLDDKKEPVIAATVEVMQGDSVKGGTVTDIDGNYEIKSLDAGVYSVKIKALGYKEADIVRIRVDASTVAVNVQLEIGGCIMGERVIVRYKVPLLDPWDPGKTTISSEQIEHMPVR